MTNPLGPGTCNIPINVATAERAILGKLAMASHCSTGALIRTLVIIGLENVSPEHAAAIKEIRRQLKSAAMLMLLIAGTWASWTTGDDMALRKPKTATVRKSWTRREVEAA